jgi:ubiquinone biosynthesis protein
MKSSSVAAKHHLQVPSELMMFFKSIVSVEGIGRKIHNDFDFLTYATEFAGEMAKTHLDPQKMVGEMAQVARESRAFLNALPRQLHFFFRKINSPDHSFRMKVPEVRELKRSVESSFNLLFLGIIIASLILSSSFIFVHPSDNQVAGIPAMSFFGYCFALALGAIAFINYIKKP